MLRGEVGVELIAGKGEGEIIPKDLHRRETDNKADRRPVDGNMCAT